MQNLKSNRLRYLSFSPLRRQFIAPRLPVRSGYYNDVALTDMPGGTGAEISAPPAGPAGNGA